MYADEIGGEGEHRYVLMFLCSLADPGLTVFPTHRLLTGLKDDTRQAGGDPRRARRATSTIEELDDARELEPPADGDRVAFGYMDSFHQAPTA